MKTSKWVLLTICLALTAGCRDDKESFSRYPSVSVPEYGSADYIRDLSDPHPELVYNAICQLGGNAGHFAKTLCATNADPASVDYKRADEAYRMVCRQLEAEEPHTVAAGLRFLQLFARNYKSKEELVEIAAGIESDHPLVQFEQVVLLRSLAASSPRLPEAQLRSFMDSPSWIVSRSAYSLISRLDQEPLRQELLQRYRETEDEREHLILIGAMKHGLEPDEARLLQNEMLASQSAGMRRAIGTTLVQNLSTPAIKLWLGDHYPQFSVKERNRIFSSCKDIELKCRFLSQGYVPQDKYLTGLLQDLLDEEEPEDRNDHLRIEQAILANQELAGRWQSMKDTAEQERRRMQALSKELEPITLEFMEKIRPLHAKYEIPESEAEEVWGIILKTVEEKMENAAQEAESIDTRS